MLVLANHQQALEIGSLLNRQFKIRLLGMKAWYALWNRLLRSYTDSV